MDGCVFCEIAGGRTDPDLTVFADDRVLAQVALHRKAGNPGQVLVLPREHVEHIWDLPAALDAPLLSAVRRPARAVRIAFDAGGVQIRQNNGPAADQTALHLHFHVIPRHAGDDFDVRPYEIAPPDARREIAGCLRAALRGEPGEG
jgi:histidine triad (HIT) family protein